MTSNMDDLIRRLEALEVLARGLTEGRKKYYVMEKIADLLSIYMFRNIFSPFDVNWIFRVKEEEIAFNLFKKTKRGDLLPHFEDLTYSGKHPQVFYVTVTFRGNKRRATIKVPKLYPSLPPNSLITSDGSIEVYTSHTNQDKCLGELVKDRWDERGRMGIAHWLLFVEVYLNLKEKPIKV